MYKGRFVLREKGLGGANPWQIMLPYATAEAVCAQMRLEEKKLGKKQAEKWDGKALDIVVGVACDANPMTNRSDVCPRWVAESPVCC